jgi:hypothetical protein
MNVVWIQTTGQLLRNPTVAHVSEIVRTNWHFLTYFTNAYFNITFLPPVVFASCMLPIRI